VGAECAVTDFPSTHDIACNTLTGHLAVLSNSAFCASGFHGAANARHVIRIVYTKIIQSGCNHHTASSTRLAATPTMASHISHTPGQLQKTKKSQRALKAYR